MLDSSSPPHPSANFSNPTCIISTPSPLLLSCTFNNMSVTEPSSSSQSLSYALRKRCRRTVIRAEMSTRKVSPRADSGQRQRRTSSALVMTTDSFLYKVNWIRQSRIRGRSETASVFIMLLAFRPQFSFGASSRKLKKS